MNTQRKTKSKSNNSKLAFQTILSSAVTLALSGCGAITANINILGNTIFGESNTRVNEYLFVSGGTTQLWEYKVDSTTGALTFVPGAPATQVWMNANHPWYSRANNSPFFIGFDIANSKVIGYNVDASTGSLSSLTGLPITIPNHYWQQDGVLDPKNRFMYYPGNNTKSLYALSYSAVAPYFAMTSWSPGTLVNKITNYSQNFAFESSGNYVYMSATDGTNYFVDVYSVNQTTGALTAVSTGTIASSTTPISSINIDPNSKVLLVRYTASPNYSISSYSIGGNGNLTFVNSVTQAASGVNWIQFDPSGKYVYVSQSNAHFAQILSIDQNTGALSVVGNNPVSGDVVGVDPTGNYLCLQFAGGTSGFGIGKVNPVTHQFTVANPQAPVWNVQSCAFSRNGNFVFVSTVANPALVYSYSIDPVTGAVTQVGSALPGPTWAGNLVSIGVPVPKVETSGSVQ